MFDDNLAGIHMNKSKLRLDRPTYVGMSILDLSKTLMYDRYYNNLKNVYGDRARMLSTDTDSLIVHIKTDDIYADMAQHADQYDMSNHPADHFLQSNKNKKVLGKMKDECAGTPIAEFVGLKPKMYSILKADGGQERRSKGVKKCVVKKYILHEQYKAALFDPKMLRHGMNVLRSKKHHIYGQHVTKITLSPLDTKRWISADGINTLAYGHNSL